MNSKQPIERIPVIVISGFPGSGKTTLVNHLLKQAPKSVVIVQEFGATPIDQFALREHKVPISVLAGGCLYDQIRDALTPVLKKLRMAWEANADKPFDRVIIETCGVANPGPVLDALQKESGLSEGYHLQTVITTVSAADGAASCERFIEAQAQFSWADAVVITHSDAASPGQLAAAGAWLDKLAPNASRLNGVQGAVAPELLLGLSKTSRPLEQIRNDSEHRFHSISLQLDDPIAWPRLQFALESLLSKHKLQLVRLKGIIFTPACSELLLIQGVANRLYQPVRLPISSTDDGKGRLVFITTGDVKRLAEDLMALLRSSS